MYDYSKLLGKMKENKLRQEDLAEIIGINAATFSQKLNGKANFKQAEIKKICDILNIAADEIGTYFFTF